MTSRTKLPTAEAEAAAQVYSHAKQHGRVVLAKAAEGLLLQTPLFSWQLRPMDSADSYEALVRCAPDRIRETLNRLMIYQLVKKLEWIDGELASMLRIDPRQETSPQPTCCVLSQQIRELWSKV